MVATEQLGKSQRNTGSITLAVCLAVKRELENVQMQSAQRSGGSQILNEFLEGIFASF
jgi:hypothetical protein